MPSLLTRFLCLTPQRETVAILAPLGKTFQKGQLGTYGEGENCLGEWIEKGEGGGNQSPDRSITQSFLPFPRESCIPLSQMTEWLTGRHHTA